MEVEDVVDGVIQRLDQLTSSVEPLLRDLKKAVAAGRVWPDLLQKRPSVMQLVEYLGTAVLYLPATARVKVHDGWPLARWVFPRLRIHSGLGVVCKRQAQRLLAMHQRMPPRGLGLR